MLFVLRNSLEMNGYFLLMFCCLVYFVEPGSFDSSTEGCFCEVSTGCDFKILLFWGRPPRSGRPVICSLQLSAFCPVDFWLWGNCYKSQQLNAYVMLVFACFLIFHFWLKFVVIVVKSYDGCWRQDTYTVRLIRCLRKLKRLSFRVKLRFNSTLTSLLEHK